jgi:hypothetical protein
MDDDPSVRPALLLDACTVINLYATRRMDDILRSTAATVGIVDAVRREAGYVRRGGAGEDAHDLEAIDLEPLFAAGLLHQAVLSEAEVDAYVALTVLLDDGEAMTLAVALSRRATLATDEKKAVRVSNDRVAVLTSLHLVQAWADADAERIERAVLRDALRDLQTLGRYSPGRGHPLKAWWDAVLADG